MLMVIVYLLIFKVEIILLNFYIFEWSFGNIDKFLINCIIINV